MMCLRRPLIIAFILLTAGCTVLPTPLPTSTPTPTPTSTPTLTPTPTPTSTFTPIPTSTPTPTPTPTLPPTPTPTPTLDSDVPSSTLSLPEPPLRPFDYIVVNSDPPRRVPNATRAFWVTDSTTGERWEITARLRAQTAHTAMWVEGGVWHDVQQLEEAAIAFETQIYSATRAIFGSEWTPGVDNDPHIHILHATGLGEGVLGYTSSADEFPRALYPRSNEAEMITVHMDQVEIGSPVYYGLLARQFQRIVQWFQDRNEERWVKEGGAELAARLNTLDSNELESAYLAHPDTSLTTWREEAADAHRGAAFSFISYFYRRFGDEGMRMLTSQPLNGIAGFDATLVELEADLTFEDIFAEWLVANYLSVEPPALAAIYENYPVAVELSVQQFGADYILLRGQDDLRVQFAGATTTRLLDVSPHSGNSFWWSNRADESLTTLTRAFDLSVISDTEPVTLTYWTRYDIEAGYDYATVEVSTDGGERWEMLPTPSGTGDNAHGNNPGWGYTGQSGDPPEWIQETVDLTPYAGDEVWVRFAYLTDEAVTGMGLLLDDIAIPKIGYADDAENGEQGWESAGFVHTDNLMPQRYLAILIGIEEGPEEKVTVEHLPVEQDSLAEWMVPLSSAGWREAVIVLSGLTPITDQAAPYWLTIEQ